MPVYIYQNPETGEAKEVVQRMTEEHTYSESGRRWDRVFTKPQAAIDTSIDIYNSREFVEKTGKKKGTVGDIWDKSAELSEKRKERNGVDDVKESAYKNYSKTRDNLTHPDKMREQLKGLSNDKFMIEE